MNQHQSRFRSAPIRIRILDFLHERNLVCLVPRLRMVHASATSAVGLIRSHTQSHSFAIHSHSSPVTLHALHLLPVLTLLTSLLQLGKPPYALTCNLSRSSTVTQIQSFQDLPGRCCGRVDLHSICICSIPNSGCYSELIYLSASTHSILAVLSRHSGWIPSRWNYHWYGHKLTLILLPRHQFTLSRPPAASLMGTVWWGDRH